MFSPKSMSNLGRLTVDDLKMWRSEPGNPQCGVVGSKSSKSVYNEYDKGKAQANTHRQKLDPSLS
jgi:hypothetical protein